MTEEKGMFSAFSKMISDKKKKAQRSKMLDEQKKEKSSDMGPKKWSEEEKRARLEGIMERRKDKEKRENEQSKARKKRALADWLKS